jgi:hypothetical protein
MRFSIGRGRAEIFLSDITLNSVKGAEQRREQVS